MNRILTSLLGIALVTLAFACTPQNPTTPATSTPSPAATVNEEEAKKQAMEDLDECKSNLKNLATALEMYGTDYGGHYCPQDQGLSLLTPNYLRTIMECPAGHGVTYTYHEGKDHELNTANYEDFYFLRCQGGHHALAGVEGDFPAYDANAGLMDNQAEYDQRKAASK